MHIDKNKLEDISKLRSKYKDLIIIIHYLETVDERKKINKKFKKKPIEVLMEYNLLNSNTILVHCNYLNEIDFVNISKSKSKIIICPISNLKMNTGIPNLEKIKQYKISFSLGTDGPATTNSLNLVECTKILPLLYQRMNFNSQALLDLITIDAASILNMQSLIGSIEEGKLANFTIYHKDSYNPFDEDYLNALFFGSLQLPCSSIVKGKFLLKNGKVLTLLNDKDFSDYGRINFFN